jgi:hypothetical protein
MLTTSEQQRLDSIERKLDHLLAILSPGSTMVDAGEAAVLASGGVKALQQYVKAQSERRARHA